MKFLFAQTGSPRPRAADLALKKGVVQAVETHTSKSFDAARKMAQTRLDNHKERKEYSAALVKESRDLSDYIVSKRTAPKKIAS